MEKGEVLNLVSGKFEIQLLDQSYEENYERLAGHIDYLINHDFNKLMSILYRVDVYESKLKNALANNSENRMSGHIIAQLLIEREGEKIRYREMYK